MTRHLSVVPRPLDPNHTYPPDLARPLLAHRRTGKDLGGQVVITFAHNGVTMAVDVFTDPLYAMREAKLIPAPLLDPRHPQGVYEAWLAAEDAMRDLADYWRERGERRSARLCDLSAAVIDDYKQSAFRAVEEARLILRRYGA